MTTEQRIVKIFAVFLATAICIAIFSAIVSGIGLFFSFMSNDTSSLTFEKEEFNLSNEDLENITTIDIDLKTTNLKIRRGSEFKIEKTNVKSDIKAHISGATLSIKEKNFFLWGNARGGLVTIYIPDTQSLNKLSIDQGAGKIDIGAIYSKSLKIDQGTGNLLITEALFDNVKIDGGVGKMSIRDSSLNDLDLDSGVGSIDIDGNLSGKCKIDGGIGSIKLNLEGRKEAYTLIIDKGLGSVTVDKEHITGRTGSGETILDIDGGVGSIKIDFKEK